MHTAVTRRTGRAHVLAATGHHPYARLATAGSGELPAYLAEGVTGWASSSQGRVFSALGDGARAVELVAAVAAAGELTGVRRLHLPRVAGSALAARLPVGEPDDWDFRWTSEAPARQPGQQRVVRLGPPDHPAVAALLALAFPASFTAPGDTRVRNWYGIWEGPELVACGADRSRGGVGSLGGIAVHPDRRGHGLGAAVTAALATTVRAEFPVVTLGVLVDNHRADQLYRRLGFDQIATRTSIDLRWTDAPARPPQSG